MNSQELLMEAMKARENAYTPYSNYKVGAALITEDGTLYRGCNIENASYGATNCAERTAIFKAVSEGHTKIKAIAIVGGVDGKELSMAYPCGICRQVMREFSDPHELKVIVGSAVDCYEEYTLEELLPHSFGPDFKEK